MVVLQITRQFNGWKSTYYGWNAKAWVQKKMWRNIQ